MLLHVPDHAALFCISGSTYVQMVVNHDLLRRIGWVILGLRVEQEVHLFVTVEHAVGNCEFVEVSVHEISNILLWQLKCCLLPPLVSLNVGYEQADLLLVVHKIELLLEEEKEVDFAGAELIYCFDKLVSAHFCRWIDAHDSYSSISALHHEEDCTFVIHDHALADHGASFADFHGFPDFFFARIIHHEIWIMFFQLLSLLVGSWHGEADWQLDSRCDTIEDDTVIVLCAEGHIETSARCDLHCDAALDGVITHAFHHTGLIVCDIQFEAHWAGV